MRLTALSCFRTAAAELPTLSMALANSSLVTPKCRVQYLTWPACSRTILLRSGVIVSVIIFAGLDYLRKRGGVGIVPLEAVRQSSATVAVGRYGESKNNSVIRASNCVHGHRMKPVPI